VLDPFDRFLYVAGMTGIATFHRDRATGALHKLPGRRGCFKVPRYVPEQPRPASCSPVPRGLARIPYGVTGLTVRPDGQNVYVAGVGPGGGVAAFARSRETGILRELPGRYGCLRRDGRYRCGRANISKSPASVAVTSGGRNAYVDGDTFGKCCAVLIFSRSS
jgi:DNA-binding beta-propeller fold protein YncE